MSTERDESAVSPNKHTEATWVEMVVSRLKPELETWSNDLHELDVRIGIKLPYVSEIHEYEGLEKPAAGKPHNRKYQTDILIRGRKHGTEVWWLLVIVECKYKGVSTHDSLTYSAKAATHKQVHPFLRYGFLIGALRDEGVPSRLFVHGAHFDFMVAWRGDEADSTEWRQFCDVLKLEVEAATELRNMLVDKKRNRKRYAIIHKPFETQPLNAGASP